MGNKPTDKILVVDLEATCWKYSPPSGQISEIIEIGVAMVIVGLDKIRIERGPEILIHPTQSEVSDFCTELTTITPRMVMEDRAMDFSDACAYLLETYPDASEMVWSSWGDYDRWMLIQECKRKNVPFPLSDRHLNLKMMTAVLRGWSKEKGLAAALNSLQMDFADDTTYHRGGDDAFNIARLMVKQMERMK